MEQDIRLPQAKDRPHYRFIVDYLLPTLLGLTGGVWTTGRRNVPTTGPALICPNHLSYLDPPLMGPVVGRRCCFMAKRSLFQIPILGPFIRASYAYPVDRDEGGRQAIRIATRLLEAGELVVIFPEGTRSPSGEMLPGKPGPSLISSRTGAPIIPVGLWGTDIVMPRFSGGLHRCPIYVCIGKPIPAPVAPDGGHVGKAQLREHTDLLMAEIARLRERARSLVPQHWLERAGAAKARWLDKYAAEIEEAMKEIQGD
ncbi:MAG: 1-acyl-sn-glycerol-3-phosphate acyltransferase [Armatimonadetes bacterium]|jgi:1-acyl-sn-glycerol-3-phosphate acyltransferase|nr:1-acyl-sn-glycerol-3-phosphate acyltransferase [Armatimonadota bacterium]